MRAVVLNKTGVPEMLYVSEIPEHEPGAGEVRVKLHYAGINYAEILSRKGLYGWAPERPYILGMEASGVIEKVGEGVDESRLGQRVMVGAKTGAYAEKIVVPENQAIPSPEGFSAVESAAFLVNYMTAWVCLFKMARAAPGEKVLVTAAAGGVGTAAVQLASAHGCRVYGMAGSVEKIDFIKSIGADGAYNYRNSACFERLLAETGGTDVVLETVGGDIFKQSLSSLNPFGRIVVAGFASLDLKKWNPYSWYKTWRDIPRADIRLMSQRSLSFMSSHIGYLMEQEPGKMEEIYRDLTEFASAHAIKPHVGKVFPLEDASEAHKFIESRNSIGKVLLKISD